MTSADRRRVRKALEGADFPADRPALFRYAADRAADSRTLEALEALPDAQYQSLDEVERNIPQSPATERGEP